MSEVVMQSCQKWSSFSEHGIVKLVGAFVLGGHSPKFRESQGNASFYCSIACDDIDSRTISIALYFDQNYLLFILWHY